MINFDPSLGSEIKKTRPALILQNNIANQYSPITIVAAITSCNGDKLYPTEVLIKKVSSGLENDSIVLLNQIRSVDKNRLIKRIGWLKKQDMTDVNRAIKISLGLMDM